jgi:DNA-binding winged helix-turn-helix (wHTH) protein
VRIGFGQFILDSDTRQLTRDGQVVHLAPKAFELLVALASDRPNAVSKAALQDRLWPNTFVVEANLSNLIAEIRGALGDTNRAAVWIRTAHGFGYAFCGEAVILPSARSHASARPACWVEWGGRRFPLSIGEHVIGRDSDVEVRLDASTVSRRHARLVVTVERAMLEDLGSKNGTLRGEERVTSPVELADGDVIHIGSVLITFHAQDPLGSTETKRV